MKNNPGLIFGSGPMATLTRNDKLMVLKLIKLLNADTDIASDGEADTWPLTT